VIEEGEDTVNAVHMCRKMEHSLCTQVMSKEEIQYGRYQTS
jgi:hypothetical protein